jgi:hypothetical protein
MAFRAPRTEIAAELDDLRFAFIAGKRTPVGWCPLAVHDAFAARSRNLLA